MAVPAFASVLIKAIAFWSGDHTGASMRHWMQSDCTKVETILPVAVSRTTMRGPVFASPSLASIAARRSPLPEIASER